MTRLAGRLGRLLQLGLLLATPAAVRAQTLRGHVTDAATRGPVSGATVTLIAADSQKVAAGISDDAGAFSVSGPAGEYTVSVQRLGYASTTDGPFRLRANGFAEINLVLKPEAIPLDSVGVSVEQQDAALLRAGFYQREQGGSGTFLDRAAIEKRGGGRRMSDVLSGLRGLRVIDDQSNGLDVQLRGSTTENFSPTGPKACLPFIYVDGLLMADGKTAGMGRMNLEVIPVNDVAGIELYVGESQVPIQFARGGGACGALLFWTRSGTPRK